MIGKNFINKIFSIATEVEQFNVLLLHGSRPNKISFIIFWFLDDFSMFFHFSSLLLLFVLRLRDLFYGVLLSSNRKKLQKTLKLLYTFNDDTLRFAFHFSSHLTLISISSCILIRANCLRKTILAPRDVRFMAHITTHYYSLYFIQFY